MIWRRRRVSAVLGLLSAALFAAFVIELSPHLVHHLFEPGQGQSDCPFAASGERQPTASGSAVTLLPAAVAHPAIPCPDPGGLPAVTCAPPAARAPPFAAS